MPAKPEPANFYPAGATKAEVEQWMQELPAPRRTRATGFFTTIRRGPDGKLDGRALQPRVPGRAGAGRAASARGGRGDRAADVKAFLEARAEAFSSNDYYDSDVAWMELDATHRADDRAVRGLRGRVVQLQGGVRGVHRRQGRGRDAKLQRFAVELQDIENNLPIDPKYRNPKLARWRRSAS